MSYTQKLNPFTNSKSEEFEQVETNSEPLAEFDSDRHADQVTQIIEDVQEDRAIRDNEVHPEGDGVTQIIEQYEKEKQIRNEIENFETPTYEEFVEENAVTSTKFRTDVHPENVLGLAGEFVDYVEASDEVLDFDLNEINNMYEERLGELQCYQNSESMPKHVEEFSGGVYTLAEAEIGLALGMAIAETEEQSSVNASVNYEQLQKEVSGGHYLAQNVRKGRELQSKAYERRDEKLHDEVEMIKGVPESLTEYSEDQN